VLYLQHLLFYVSLKMLYQLPNGKVIYLSTEEYLSMSDEELHQLAFSGFGEEPSYGTYFSKGGKRTTKPKLDKLADLDYKPEKEDTDLTGPIDMNNLPEE